ncbi:MAG: DUF1566 domain-containing protein, partial [Nitrospinaceae bacterium]|nr:DUF1566 domain-containing protein [Nitrospinaceae bacterium]NIR53421.1 DUF1566 domain-containing protein [Nitrospinaceae bacterium]NIS83820.1 DUF1566 domain-containing protein [Nitrospinaceae bacterium]NIT80616.1 DUF1566 domain-containing protein [Nitrospinaceae bacterium]NIU42940.1 DUF1566 domain-containing protein [Nitrospinaceae bacterium]
MRFQSQGKGWRIWKRALLVCGWVVWLSGTSAAEGGDSGNSKDEIFDGQILSLTDPHPDLPPSDDARFTDNQDGTVTDHSSGLMWKKKDSYQEEKKWMNWEMAKDFVKRMNEKKFAGFSDWRLPTREELKTLYDESKSIPWKYYWTTNEVHIDPVFGNTSCCFWSSETYGKKYAWSFNFIRGKAYPSPKAGPGLS